MFFWLHRDRLVTFPFEERRRTRRLQGNAVELAVTGGVADVADLVLRVEQYPGPEKVGTLWTRPSASG